MMQAVVPEGTKPGDTLIQAVPSVWRHRSRDGCEKRHFLSHIYIKANIVPRQARDKHRENSKKSGVLCSAVSITSMVGLSQVRSDYCYHYYGDFLFLFCFRFC
jgi:hypothetical protein